MKLFKILISVLLLKNIQSQYCTNFQFNQGPYPFPKLPDEFQVRVEVNNLDDKKTTEINLFYDLAQGKTALEKIENNNLNRIIFDYQSNQIFQIKANLTNTFYNINPPDNKPQYKTSCEAFNLTDMSVLNNFFGYEYLNDTILVPGPPEKAFRFYPQTYDRNDTVRGIPCDVYKSCQYDPYLKLNYTVEHYFSVESFVYTFGNNSYTRIPIQAIYKGVAMKSFGILKNFTVIHSYHYFKKFNLNKNVFYTPSTVYCKNRKSTKQMPVIRQEFTYNQEVVSNDGIQYIRDIYLTKSFSRFEITNNQKQNITQFSTDPQIFMNDFSIGIQYVINKNTGRCSLLPLRRNSYDQQSTINSDFNAAIDFAFHLQSNQDFIYSSGDYVYTGKQDRNGIPCDVFMAKTSQGIYEYAFSDGNFTISNLNEFEDRIPVSLTVDFDEFSSRSSFFNYDTSTLSLSLPDTYNLESCFKARDILKFNLVFPYKDSAKKFEMEYQENLEEQIRNILVDLTSESYHRFASPKIRISDDGNLYAQISIYPNPPPLRSLSFTNPNEPNLKNVSIDDCARTCLDDLKCLSFDYEITKYFCYINRNTSPQGPSVPGNEYSHYIRTASEPKLSKENFQLYENFENAVSKKFIKLEILILDEDLSFSAKFLNATKIYVISNFGFDSLATTNLLTKYTLKRSKSRFTAEQDLNYDHITIDDCARYCDERIGYECNSFDYCFVNGECKISRNLILDDNLNEEYMPDEYCDIYEKNALADYERFPTQTSINLNDQKFENILSPNDCAQKCNKQSIKECKSFNFCPTTNTCYLSSSHLADGSASTVQSEELICNHYSKKFESDFLFLNSQSTFLEAEVILTDSSLDLCSLTCSISTSLNCQSFDYCQNTKTCLLNSALIKTSIKNNTTSTDICAHYIKNKQKSTDAIDSNDEDNKSEKILIGLTVSFFFVGLISGTIGTVYFLKKKLKPVF